jgi:hypothetical protein
MKALEYLLNPQINGKNAFKADSRGTVEIIQSCTSWIESEQKVNFQKFISV